MIGARTRAVNSRRRRPSVLNIRTWERQILLSSPGPWGSGIPQIHHTAQKEQALSEGQARRVSPVAVRARGFRLGLVRRPECHRSGAPGAGVRLLLASRRRHARRRGERHAVGRGCSTVPADIPRPASPRSPWSPTVTRSPDAWCSSRWSAGSPTTAATPASRPAIARTGGSLHHRRAAVGKHRAHRHDHRRRSPRAGQLVRGTFTWRFTTGDSATGGPGARAVPEGSMSYRSLGATGLKVSEISLGSWTTYGGSIGDEDSAHVIHRAFELGINLFDTADVTRPRRRTSARSATRSSRCRASRS